MTKRMMNGCKLSGNIIKIVSGTLYVYQEYRVSVPIAIKQKNGTAS